MVVVGRPDVDAEDRGGLHDDVGTARDDGTDGVSHWRVLPFRAVTGFGDSAGPAELVQLITHVGRPTGDDI